MTTRRAFLWGSCALAVLAKFGFIVNARAQSRVPDAELAQPSPLGDVVMGSPDAPVTVIEYASMTCPHCAHFSTETFPKVKEKYIDTGKVRYIMREFPLNQPAVGLVNEPEPESRCR